LGWIFKEENILHDNTSFVIVILNTMCDFVGTDTMTGGVEFNDENTCVGRVEVGRELVS